MLRAAAYAATNNPPQRHQGWKISARASHDRAISPYYCKLAWVFFVHAWGRDAKKMTALHWHILHAAMALLAAVKLCEAVVHCLVLQQQQKKLAASVRSEPLLFVAVRFLNALGLLAKTLLPNLRHGAPRCLESILWHCYIGTERHLWIPGNP
jgi:hypothetical protein